MTRWVICFVLCTGLFVVGCQNQPKAPKSDPAYELQQSQAQSHPIVTPIPSSTRDKPIVITELPPNDATALSDGMMDGDANDAKHAVTAKPKPQIVVEEPDRANTTPMTARPVTSLPQTRPQAMGPSDKSFGLNIAKAHNSWRWGSNRCIQTDIQLMFNGKVRLQGKLLTDRQAGHVRLSLSNGAVLVYDGKDVWMSPPNAPVTKPRFDALTWAYFLTAPFKFNDPGTHLQNMGALPLFGNATYSAGKLTFSDNVGDSPDDWYIAYVDPRTRWLRGMAYIVTYGKSVAQAEKTPHAITYDNYVNVAGVILPRTWTFWNWSQDKGVTGSPIGHAILNNLRMVYPAANSFTKPADAVLCEAPQ